MISGHASIEDAIKSTKLGALDFLEKPLDRNRVVVTIRNAVEHHAMQVQVQKLHAEVGSQYFLLGDSQVMEDLRRQIAKIAPTKTRVLITGESGTGKELIARAIHRNSLVSSGEFVKVNCAAIPPELIESELFGHERGSFTGAVSRKRGLFEIADTGTIFLDEIGDMSLSAQAKVLRVLQTGDFSRVGGEKTLSTNCRVVAATNKDLQKAVESGEFREDLFHRLNVIRIQLPALNERKEDIAALAKHFLTKAASELDVAPKSLSADVEQYLMELNWPGNVRQLENVCRWLTVMSPSQIVQRDDLPNDIAQGDANSDNASGDWKTLFKQWATRKALSGQDKALANVVSEVEELLMEVALERTAGKRQEAAKLLGWGRNTLTRKLKDN